MKVIDRAEIWCECEKTEDGKIDVFDDNCKTPLQWRLRGLAEDEGILNWKKAKVGEAYIVTVSGELVKERESPISLAHATMDIIDYGYRKKGDVENENS